MAARTNFPGLKQAGDDSPTQRALVGNQTLLGKTNNSFDLTLIASAASTTISDPRILSTSGFNFDPRTDHAMTELYGGTMRVTSVSNGSVTIKHANNAQVDRTFVVTIFH